MLTFRWSEWRRAVLVCEFERLVPAAIAHLCVRRMTTGRKQIVLTLAVALAGAAVMLATARTFNRVFCCLESEAYGWPFPWETIDSHHSGPGLRHPADYWVYNFTILLGASFFIGRCARGWSA